MSRSGPWFLGLCFVLAAGCERPAPPPTPAAVSAGEARAAVEGLVACIGRRLAVMHDVARAKWNTQAPVYDPERERRVLEEVVAQGQRAGLDADLVRAVFTAQLEAARLIQEDDHRRWQAERQAPFPDAPGLPALRQRIDALNAELLDALARARPSLETPDGRQLVEGLAGAKLADYPPAVRDAALRPLRRP